MTVAAAPPRVARDALERFLATCKALSAVRGNCASFTLYESLKRDLVALNPTPQQYARGIQAAVRAAGV